MRKSSTQRRRVAVDGRGGEIRECRSRSWLRHCGIAARRFLPRLFIALLCCAVHVRVGVFEEANDLHDQSRHLEARQRYEQLVEEGNWSANLFYNLGNTDYRLGATGLAMLNYERALALEPGHPEANANLKLLREQTGAKTPERTWIDRVFFSWSTDVLAVAAAVASWSAIFLLFAIWFRRAATAVWSGLVLSVFIATYSMAGVRHRDKEATTAVIIANRAEARLAPADRAGLAESLPAGSRVRILSERGEWIYCALPGQGLGWIKAASLKRVRLARA